MQPYQVCLAKLIITFTKSFSSFSVVRRWFKYVGTYSIFLFEVSFLQHGMEQVEIFRFMQLPLPILSNE